MDMKRLMMQAQKMQKELTRVEKELNEQVYEATVGGGVISVEVKGSMEVTNITIDEQLLEKEGKEDLEELLKSAVNAALQTAVKDKEKKMNAITSGVKLPGTF